jgi:hypothetical protein
MISSSSAVIRSEAAFDNIDALARMKASVSPSMPNPRLPAMRTARIMRSGSAARFPAATIRTSLRSMSPAPSKGSRSSCGLSTDRAIAPMVKSRRERSASIVPPSRSVKSQSSPASTTRQVSSGCFDRQTRRPPVRLANAAAASAALGAAQSTSFGSRPSSASRTAPPTIQQSWERLPTARSAPVRDSNMARASGMRRSSLGCRRHDFVGNPVRK